MLPGMGSITTRVPVLVSSRKQDWPYQVSFATGAAARATRTGTATAAARPRRQVAIRALLVRMAPK
jgi:hypothetical protein